MQDSDVTALTSVSPFVELPPPPLKQPQAVLANIRIVIRCVLVLIMPHPFGPERGLTHLGRRKCFAHGEGEALVGLSVALGTRPHRERILPGIPKSASTVANPGHLTGRGA